MKNFASAHFEILRRMVKDGLAEDAIYGFIRVPMGHMQKITLYLRVALCEIHGKRVFS